MGVAALVLGIASLVCGCFLPGLQWIGSITGLIGIILGALGRKNSEKKGIATAGLVCSIIGFVLSTIFYVACVACASIGSSLLNGRNLFRQRNIGDMCGRRLECCPTALNLKCFLQSAFSEK